jgi:integrase
MGVLILPVAKRHCPHLPNTGAVNLPVYSDDISEKGVLVEEDVWKMYAKAKTVYERLYLSISWISGARPAEIIKTENAPGLTRSDIKIEPDKISFWFHTLKLKKTEAFQLKKRQLTIARPSGANLNPYIETIVEWWHTFKYDDVPIFPYTKRWAEKVINRLGTEAIGRKVSPYHLRHSAITREAANNRSIDQLMHFKGAKSMQSVQPYLHANSYEIMMEARKKEDVERVMKKRGIVLEEKKEGKEVTPYEEYLNRSK